MCHQGTCDSLTRFFKDKNPNTFPIIILVHKNQINNHYKIFYMTFIRDLKLFLIYYSIQKKPKYNLLVYLYCGLVGIVQLYPVEYFWSNVYPLEWILASLQSLFLFLTVLVRLNFDCIFSAWYLNQYIPIYLIAQNIYQVHS